MNRLYRLVLWASGFMGVLLFTGCGIAIYPGQPGVVTNNYSKIDLEDLQGEGLYVYETTYDNRPGAAGVAAIVTKLYPNAQTYTSCVRTNADGTVNRVKGAYEGATVQMISLPQVNQIMMPPDSHIVLMTQYTASLDEIDDVNLAEMDLFKRNSLVDSLTPSAFKMAAEKLNLLKAAHLSTDGTLSYEVVSADLEGKKFTPSQPLSISTNFAQNGIRSDVGPEARKELANFIEQNFARGFKGLVKIEVKGASKPVSIPLGIHTVKTATAAGIKVIRNASDALIQSTLNRVAQLTK